MYPQHKNREQRTEQSPAARSKKQLKNGHISLKEKENKGGKEKSATPQKTHERLMTMFSSKRMKRKRYSRSNY